MIKQFTYVCDGGTIMLGNETSRVCLPNGYGDGEFSIEVRDLDDKDCAYSNNMNWLGTIQGNNLHIYNYDCINSGLEDKENILYTLPEGRWAVYHSEGDILIEQWD